MSTFAATAGEVQSALGQVGDLSAALSARLANVAADEQLAEDVLGDLASIGVPYAGALAALVPLFVWIITHNESATPGALVKLPSGARGSNPQMEDGA
jgi:hypothetical protein